MFSGRTLLIVTKHAKEKVIAPILEKELGVKCVVTVDFDTDLLGTFAGEVDRKDDPITTVRKKCLLAMKLANCDLAVASEGSFGPHPSIYFIPADDEFLILIDQKNDLEIIVRELSTETNFNEKEIHSEKELKEFANRAQFPTHGLILRKNKEDFSTIKKENVDWETLFRNYRALSSTDGIAYVETDMRAMKNPTRMKIIEKVTANLVEKINSVCPQCSTPGFDVLEINKGLPCELCNFPTRSTLSYVYVCKKCNFAQNKNNPHGKLTESPEFCDICNP
jgi:hypothetical protein